MIEDYPEAAQCLSSTEIVVLLPDFESVIVKLYKNQMSVLSANDSNAIQGVKLGQEGSGACESSLTGTGDLSLPKCSKKKVNSVLQIIGNVNTIVRN